MNNDFINIEKLISVFSRDFEKTLISFLPKALFFSDKLNKAMYYVVKVGGKRLRPLILSEISSILGIKKENSDRVAAGIEFIHCYSLVHDDLPAMDNDDLRRGRPTNHKVYGDAIAILAGDALLTRAFEMVSLRSPGVDPNRLLNVVGELSLVAGAPGLVGGQVVDLKCEGKEVDLETLEYIHLHKTGALLKACVRTGAMIAGANEELLQALTTYAEGIGLAFQIIDDILDLTSSSEKLGKTAGKDLLADKTTYPKLLGMEESKKRAFDLVEKAKKAIEPWGAEAKYLISLADFITNRDR